MPGATGQDTHTSVGSILSGRLLRETEREGNTHISWVKYSSKICDLWPQEKGNQGRTNTIVVTTHIYVNLFSLLYMNYLHII